MTKLTSLKNKLANVQNNIKRLEKKMENNSQLALNGLMEFGIKRAKELEKELICDIVKIEVQEALK